jgi:hypothetical protein
VRNPESNPRHRGGGGGGGGASAVVAGFLTAIALIAVAPVRANFVLVGDTPLTTSGTHRGICLDGANTWHIANSTGQGFYNYSANFQSVSTSTNALLTDVRGLTFNSASLTPKLYLSDLASGSSSTIREVAMTGAVTRSWTVPGQVEGLAYERRIDALWLAKLDGTLERRGATVGGLHLSFSTPYNWRGMAYDSYRQTLLLLSDDDRIIEYSLGGAFNQVAIDSDQIPGDGAGLAYDPPTGRLWVTSETPGNVRLFQDVSRVPEPTSACAAVVITVATLTARRVRSCGRHQPC